MAVEMARRRMRKRVVGSMGSMVQMVISKVYCHARQCSRLGPVSSDSRPTVRFRAPRLTGHPSQNGRQRHEVPA